MEPLKRLTPGETFRFACHPGVPCFNACCRDLTQFLTPYDIIRLKKRLGLSSTRFLETYTEWHTGPRSGLPVVSLKALTQGLECPFVGPEGCTVYEDRPGACRTYPLGRMVSRKPGSAVCQESFFLIKEPHCQGFCETRQWTVEAWNKGQGLTPYNALNDRLMDVLAAKRQSGKKTLTPKETELFLFACYDMDGFRQYFLENALWKTPIFEQERHASAAEDEEQMITFALAWVKQELFGSGTNKEK